MWRRSSSGTRLSQQELCTGMSAIRLLNRIALARPEEIRATRDLGEVSRVQYC
jgi:hypothetical protein